MAMYIGPTSATKTQCQHAWFAAFCY